MNDEPDKEEEPGNVTLPYPFVDEGDQKLRCFIAEHFLNAEIEDRILIESMQHIFEWVKDGKVLPKERHKPKLVKPDA